MAKILNLDNLAKKEVRELLLDGKTYKVREMSVEDFIETSRIAEKLESESSFAVQMEESIKLIQRAIPDIEPGVLKALSMEQLAALSQFVRGEDPAEIGTEAADPGKA